MSSLPQAPAPMMIDDDDDEVKEIPSFEESNPPQVGNAHQCLAIQAAIPFLKRIIQDDCKLDWDQIQVFLNQNWGGRNMMDPFGTYVPMITGFPIMESILRFKGQESKQVENGWINSHVVLPTELTTVYFVGPQAFIEIMTDSLVGAGYKSADGKLFSLGTATKKRKIALEARPAWIQRIMKDEIYSIFPDWCFQRGKFVGPDNCKWSTNLSLNRIPQSSGLFETFTFYQCIGGLIRAGFQLFASSVAFAFSRYLRNEEPFPDSRLSQERLDQIIVERRKKINSILRSLNASLDHFNLKSYQLFELIPSSGTSPQEFPGNLTISRRNSPPGYETGIIVGTSRVISDVAAPAPAPAPIAASEVPNREFKFQYPDGWKLNPSTEPRLDIESVESKHCFDIQEGDDRDIKAFLKLNIYENIVIKHGQGFLCFTRTEIAKQLDDKAGVLIPCKENQMDMASKFYKVLTPSGFIAFVPRLDFLQMVENTATQIFELRLPSKELSLKLKDTISLEKAENGGSLGRCQRDTNQDIYRLVALKFLPSEAERTDVESRAQRVLDWYKRMRQSNSKVLVSEFLKPQEASGGKRFIEQPRVNANPY